MSFHEPRAQLPSFCHISCGDLARLITSHVGSPLISSIARQLAERRRRKVAFGRLTEVLHKVVAEGLQATEAQGIIIDGLRPSELPAFQRVVGCEFIALVSLACPPNEMLVRLKQREHREGDERLGLVELDDAGRVKAFEEREAIEIEQLKTHKAFLPLAACGSQTVEDLAKQVLAFAPIAPVAEKHEEVIAVDWASAIGKIAAYLDQHFHPDGKPR